MVSLLFISRENCENNRQNGQNGIQSLLSSVRVYSLTVVDTSSAPRQVITRGTYGQCRSAVTKAMSPPSQCSGLGATKLAQESLHPIKPPSTSKRKIDLPNRDCWGTRHSPRQIWTEKGEKWDCKQLALWIAEDLSFRSSTLLLCLWALLICHFLSYKYDRKLHIWRNM